LGHRQTLCRDARPAAVGATRTNLSANGYNHAPWGRASHNGDMKARNPVLRVRRAFGPAVEGIALVSSEGFSPRYDLDRTTGIITKIGHALEGERLAGKVLFTPTAKGGVAAGWAFFDMQAKGFAPLALVFGKTNPVMVQGAVFAGIAITEGWTPDALQVVKTGDRVRVDPKKKTIQVLEPLKVPV
jgi:predicted aconitase with swiveling domain